MPNDVAFDDYIAERLKYQLNLDEKKIESYSKLKEYYREETGKVYNIPEDHDPAEPYMPTYQEHKEYYELISEYHRKLKNILGTKGYQRYERMRAANNKKVFRDWQENEGQSDLQYMQF